MAGYNEIIEYVSKIRDDIASLRIRGATRIAITVMETVKKAVMDANTNVLDKVFNKAIDILFWSRPTEPAMQNGLNYVKAVYNDLKTKGLPINEIKEGICNSADEYLTILKKSFDQIVEIGWKRIPDEAVVMTHCHSTTVVNILKKAKDSGKKVTVIASETRPLYQGRRTTRDLIQYGIKVYHIVDSAMRWVARKFKPDLAIIGSDAIGSNGVVINKIGSELLALVANEFDFPFYVATSLLKLDLKTVVGEYIPIEMRNEKEVWPDVPEGVTILNPAFETVAPRYIDAMITEAGVIPPSNILVAFKEHYPKIWKVILNTI